MLIERENKFCTEIKGVSNHQLSVATLDNVYFYLNQSKKRADSDISPRTTSTDTKYYDIHRSSKERSLSCVTTICPQSPIQSDKNSLCEFNISNVAPSTINHFWNYMTTLKEKITEIFWSIVSLDGDKPLYDYSAPLPEIVSYLNLESDVTHENQLSFLEDNKHLSDS